VFSDSLTAMIGVVVIVALVDIPVATDVDITVSSVMGSVLLMLLVADGRVLIVADTLL
jgi:hypothetical protein